jgi:acetoin utilization deacetylase AcuC-like enzyme
VQTAAEEVFPTTTTSASASVLSQHQFTAPTSSQSKRVHTSSGQDVSVTSEKSVASDVLIDSEGSEHDVKALTGSDSHSSGRQLLCSILGVVDAKVRVSNQLAQMHDIVRVKNAVEDRRVEQFVELGDLLTLKVSLLQSKHTISESEREGAQKESLNFIGSMEAEEKELAEKLKRIRDEISHAKRNLVEHQEASKLAKLSEKARIYTATRESNKCGEMLSTAERNKDLLRKFKAYVTALTGNPKWTPVSKEEGPKIKIAKTSDQEEGQKKVVLHGNTDSLNLMRKLSHWVEKAQCQQSTQKVHETLQTQPATSVLLFSRLMYEGMRLSRRLLSKYNTSRCKWKPFEIKDDISNALEITDSEGSSEMDEFEKLFTIQDLYNDDAQPLVSVLSDATLEKDSVLSECVMATVNDICRRVEIDAALKHLEACKLAEEPSAVKKGVTVVLCDPRNLSHLVPRKMPERSIRIVKIMAKLSALQVTLAEEKVKGLTRSNDDDGEKPMKLDAADMLMDICMSSTADVDSDGKSLPGLQLGDSEPLQHVGSYDESVQEDSSPRGDGDFYDRCAPRRVPTEELEIRCLARDASIALQDCFWESVALVHADEYIDHLRERAKAASCFNPPYLPMKDHAIAGEVDADVQFISLLQEEIPVDEADIRAAAEESGDPLPIAMLRRNARSSGRSGSCGSSSMGANSSSNGNYVGYEDDGDMMGGKGRQRSSSTPLNRLAIPQNVADALLAFREEAWTPDFAPNDSDRVWMWDTMRCRRVGGYAAPFFKNLRDCLSRNSHFLVYTGQDDKEETPPIQWDIVQWLRQAVDLSAGGDFIIPTGTVRKAGDYQGDYEEEREKIGPGGKRRKQDDSTSGLKSKFRDPASKFLVRTSKGTSLSKSKGGLSLHGLSKRPMGHGTGDLMHPDMGEGEGEVKHKINLGAFSAFRRISVWNTVRRVRVSGGNAPMKKDLKAFLEEKPEYVIWTGQRVAGVDVDGDRRRVASKAKIIKKVSTKIGKPKAAPDSQKSRFSALSRVSVKASTVPSTILPAVQKDKVEKLDKGDKGEKVILPKLTKEELLMCVPAVRVKKEKKQFEASLFLPSSRRVGDRVRAKVAGGYGDEEGCYREPDIDGVEEGDGGEEGRVSLWNTVKQCRVAGGNAPYRRDLQEYLANRPEYCVYEGQEPLVPRMMKAERDALKSGRGRGRGRGGRGGRGRGRGCASVAHASPSHLTEVKPDLHTIPVSPTAATVPSPSELKIEKTTNTPQLSTKVQSASSSSCGTVPRPVKLLILSLPSESKKKAGKSVAQLLEDSMASPIPLWNSRRKSCLSGRNAPIRSLLVKFLATRPEYEIYTGQDLRDNDDDELTRILALSIAGDDAPQLSYAAERISMWDNVRLLKIEGEEAPMRCDLTDYIATHPDRDVYINQEEVLEAERNRNMESDSDSDASSGKKIYKSSKAKNKIAQLLANLRPKKDADIVPPTAAAAAVVCAPSEPVNVNVNTCDWIEESNISSSSSHRPDTADANVDVLPVVGEECLEVPVVKVEVVPLKRGRKARCLKRLESSLHDKAVKPLKKGHVSVWNTLRQCRVSGGNAPLRSQLSKFLITRPEYEVWVGQERQRKKRSPGDQGAVDGMDNEAFDGVYDDIAGDADGDEETDDHLAPMDHAPQEDDMPFDTDPVYELIPIPTPHPPSTALTSTVATDVQPIDFPPSLESITQASQQQQQQQQQTDHITIALEVPDVLAAVIQTPEKSPLHGRVSRKRSLSLSMPMPMAMPSTVTGTAIGDIPCFPQLHAPTPAVLQEKIDTLIEAIPDSVITPLPDLPGVDAPVAPSSSSIHNVNNIHLHQYPTAESIPSENLMSVTSLPMSVPMPVPTTEPMTKPMPVPTFVPMTVSMDWVEQEHIPMSIPLPIETVSSSASHKVDNEPEQSLPDTVYREAEVVIPQVDSNPDTNHTAKTENSRQVIPPVLSNKGVVVLPSRAKRRRELANTEDSSSFMAFSSIDEEAEEPSPSGDGHQINGRSIIGDRFIRHCGEDSVVSGPGWWEDLDIGASDTYISPCSFDAAVAAAAVVCAGVDAVTLGHVTGCDLLAAAKAHDEALAAVTAERPNLSGPSIPSSLDSDIGEKEVNIEQIIQSSSSSLPEDTAVVEPIAPPPAAAPTSSSSAAASATTTEVIEEVMEDVMEEVIEDVDPLGAVRMEQMNDLLDGIREERKLVTVHATVPHIEPSHSVVNSVDHELSQVNTEEGTLMQSCDVVSASSSSLIVPGESNGDIIPNYTDKILQLPHPVVPYNDVNTRSRVGAMAAAGVLTSETLGSIAADTPVVLTDVEGVKNVFCCIRPPGHHAGRFGSTRGCSNNGFCLLNNVAIGAYYARIKYGLRKFAVVDIDAHFGNGTAEIFEGDPHAFYSSVHLQYDGPKNYFFPSSTCCILGAEERNPNRVLVNVYPPVRPGNPLSKSGKPRSRRGFRTAFEDVILPALKAFNPDIIFISAGFDGASTDPIGGQMGLKPVDFHWMAEKIQVVADEVCGGRVVSVLEGGYDVSKAADGLATCAEAHVLALAGREFR